MWTQLRLLVVAFSVAGLGAGAAWADAGLSDSAAPAVVLSSNSIVGQSVSITPDVALAAGSSMSRPLTIIPVSQPFVWQVRDSALAKDPVTIEYQPPVRVTLSFDLERHNRLPITRLPAPADSQSPFTANNGTSGSAPISAAPSSAILTTLANLH